MTSKWLLLIFLASMACQGGRIPCPKVKTVKIKKSTINSRAANTFALYAKEDDVAPGTEKNGKYTRTESKFVKNVSVEEWDCPRPGEKKYMPKNVKHNIRRNLRKINAESKADSLSRQ